MSFFKIVISHIVRSQPLFATQKIANATLPRHLSRSAFFRAIHDISALQLKKRAVRKKRAPDEEATREPGIYDVVAFATAEEYNLESLVVGLKAQDLYEPNRIENNPNVVRAVAKYRVDREPREIFFFREGSVVLWNTNDLENSNVLGFLKRYEQDGYSEKMVQSESEYMNYRHQEAEKPSQLDKSGDILLSVGESNVLDKYTFSNAMSLSVKLGIWEASLEQYVDSIEVLTEDLKRGNRIRISREDCLRKHGELFALRHLINLGSDLLDVPDFYWEHEQLEKLYLQTCAYFSISKRTKVMNEKLNHCVELIELISSHLTDNHHTRLEWMIIILIMVEVAFETLHYVERFYI